MKRNKILLTNDDGIGAMGLFHLYQSLKGIADLIIAAPDREQSGTGVGITVKGPLRVEQVSSFSKVSAWKIGGTPADCVKLAVTTLMDFSPDLIVSGINHGSNAGRNVLYSGTNGGAIEAALRGIPAIALSYACEKTREFPYVEPLISPIIEYLQEHPLPSGSFLNVNLPHLQEKEFKGFKMTRQGKGYWMENPEYDLNLKDGYHEYWIDGGGVRCKEDDQSDVFLLDQGYATAVPINVNELTHLSYFFEKKKVFEQRLNMKKLHV